METIRNWFYERWYKTSTDENMRRCSCWHHLQSITPSGAYIAVNNGWFPTWQQYPHATYCKNPQR